MPEQLKPVICPDEIKYLWAWYCELAAVRGSNGYGPNPISYRDISDWSLWTGSNPDPFEVGCIMAIDRIYLDHISKRAKDGDKRK